MVRMVLVAAVLMGCGVSEPPGGMSQDVYAPEDASTEDADAPDASLEIDAGTLPDAGEQCLPYQAPCDFDHVDACCSGMCFPATSPFCMCLSEGQDCAKHRNGCCANTECKPRGYGGFECQR